MSINTRKGDSERLSLNITGALEQCGASGILPFGFNVLVANKTLMYGMYL